MDVKFIAFYLPQFHEIPENNEWWGKGFTEWERVKNAKPLFPGHNQPRVPYKYYDLSDTNVLKEQSEMALKYGVDGFCYYHYWFNGKKLLEKPLEMMLENKEIKIPFCLSWANEPWTRAWEGKSKEILMSQNYGNRLDWLKHLEYLIPFFKDDRYIRIDDKPVFLIYRTESFDKFDVMMELWNDRIKHYGIKEIFFVETLNSFQKKPVCKNSSAVVEFEPMFSLSRFSSNYIKSLNSKIYRLVHRTNYRLVKYEKIWRRIINRNNNHEKRLFLGAFTDWDNTPRFKEYSTIFVGSTPEKFEFYLKKQIEKVRGEDTIIFINAWNEWAEGVHLEPCNIWNTSFLEVLKKIKDNNLL